MMQACRPRFYSTHAQGARTTMFGSFGNPLAKILLTAGLTYYGMNLVWFQLDEPRRREELKQRELILKSEIEHELSQTATVARQDPVDRTKRTGWFWS